VNTQELTAAESVQMVELTTSEDGLLWLQLDSIYSIEKSPTEDNTIVKTMMGDFTTPHAVKETPAEIAAAIVKLREALEAGEPFDKERSKQQVRDAIERSNLESEAMIEVYDELGIDYLELEPPQPSVYRPRERLAPEEIQKRRDERAQAWYDDQMGVDNGNDFNDPDADAHS
jgi:hypothetical protein